ncbi:DNA repair protein RecN [Erysipelotrichaceae bacterium OH741_COT-311]|nr:DNA repair protein RecN [Erysipelotrichaceae bacterium OH741_COT-311]
MIKSIYIKDFVIIDEINLEFNQGFSAFTGETGAGKSIIVDAISYLKGQRIDVSVIKKGASQAIIEGVFLIDDCFDLKEKLKDAEIEVENELIITRIISQQKNSIKINHRNVTLSFLKDCLSQYIDIHSQHDSQYLLAANNHIHLLDTYIQDTTLIKEVKEKYLQLKKAEEEYDIAINQTYNLQDLDYFKFQLEEINNADIKENEDLELEEQEKQLKTYEKSFETINALIELIEHNQVLAHIYTSYKKLNELSEFEELASRLHSAYLEVEDIYESINNYIHSIDYSLDQVNEIQQRLFIINRLKRKYQFTIQGIFNAKKEFEEKIHNIEHRSVVLEQLQKQLHIAKEEFYFASNTLSKIRKQKALELEKHIQQHLKDLMLNNAQFKIQICEGKVSSDGIDDVEFYVAMNLNQSLQPLTKVASGGELSRLMLGIKTVFSQLQGIKTIIFDEIDTGVSGPIASVIGQKMLEISMNTQVFAVTHLAQVASCSNYHYHVCKKDKDTHTVTDVTLLNYQQRIEQLAYISNDVLSESSLKAAEELLKKNQQDIYG